MNVLVIGAGIAGTTLAVALARRGIACDVIERRESVGAVGAGVVLGPNVMAALGPLGLDEAVAARANPLRAGRVVTQEGKELSRMRYEVEGYRWPGMAIHRGALHEVLHGALATPARLGVTVRELVDRDDGVLARLSDGSEALYDLVVGADGVRSALRDALNPGFTTTYAGYTCWRFVVDDTSTSEVTEAWGRGQRLGIVPLGEGRTYVFLTENAARGAPSPFTDVEGLRARFAGYPAPADALLAKVTSLAQVLHNDLEDGIPARWWAPRRVLIGDAAHAVTPNMGQGAGLAIEDAACLAALLAEGGANDATLAKFQQLRQPRATWIRDQSRQIGAIGQWENAAARWLRDLALRATPASVTEASLRRVVTDMPGVPV